MLVNLPTLEVVMCWIQNKYQSLVKNLVFYKLDPQHDLNKKRTQFNFKHCKLYIRVGLYTFRAYLHETAVHTSVHTAFLKNKHTKSTHKTITKFLCPIFKDIKDRKTHKMNNIQIRELIPWLFEKKLRFACIQSVFICVITLLR